MKLILFNFCILVSLSAFSQESTLSSEQVLEWIRNYHPIVKQANISIEKSKAEILSARGAFDPFLNTYLSQKSIDGINYYKDISPELRLPTWVGIDLYAGTESYFGSRLNPVLTQGQSAYVGLTIPLVKNLIFDKRRAYLNQAKIFKTISENEQQSIINTICMEAMEAYWNWVNAYQALEVVKQNVNINEKRLDFIKKSFVNGERSAIDTIETAAQLQSFKLMQSENQMAFLNAGLDLSAFLWKENDEPFILPENVVPNISWDNENFILQFQLSLSELLIRANNHPDLLIYQSKLNILNIDKKLMFQDLLPTLDFQYFALRKDYQFSKLITDRNIFQDNYQYGLKFEMPLFLSKGRANFKKAKLMIDYTKLSQNQKVLNVELKVKTYYNEFITFQNQVRIQKINYEYYKQLLKAEETLFQNGESSLFLINSRETKAQEALLKLVDLKIKYFKSIYKLQWSAGLLR